MAELPVALCVRILKKGGAKRVSEEAGKYFAQVLEELALDISKKAVDIAKQDGRKTLKVDDIKQALIE